MLKQSTSKLLLISSLCAFTNAALAGYEIKILLLSEGISKSMHGMLMAM